MNTEEIWNKSLLKIQGKVDSNVLDLWFKPIKLSNLKDQTATLDIPNRFFKEWIDDSYPNLIKESIEAITGYQVSLKYRIEERQPVAQKKIIEKLENRRMRLAHRGIYLNPRYTFDNFVPGNSNQFARAAAMAVAETPGKTYNPLGCQT